eukprot:jgi/Mesen1/6561/ME000336S05783
MLNEISETSQLDVNSLRKREGTNGVLSTHEESMQQKMAAKLETQAQEIQELQLRLKSAQEASAPIRDPGFQQQLMAAFAERDKARRDLGRLKQHLLDLESAEADKMEAENERLIELESTVRRLTSQNASLQASLAKAQAEAAAAQSAVEEGAQISCEELERLREQLADCQAALESKDKEINNLQIVLGQYYAESEAQDRLRSELHSAREQAHRLADDIQATQARLEEAHAQREAAMARGAAAEQKLAEAQQRMVRGQEEGIMLRRALEQSMVRLNRMSTDSDFYIDRRIVIKLLVTYFEKNFSKEVLDLMARMLGFSEEEKKRLNAAYQGARGAGVVQGVLGIPGKLVGGFLGGMSSGSHGDDSSPPLPLDESMSFSNLWIDFLLKESEERERREKAEQAHKSSPSPLPATFGQLPSSPLSPRTPRVNAAAAASTTSTSHSSPHAPFFTPSHIAKSAGSFSHHPSRQISAVSPITSPNFGPPSQLYTSNDSPPVIHSNGFVVDASGANSSMFQTDSEYQSGGEFSPIALTTSTPQPPSLMSPYNLQGQGHGRHYT